MTNLEKDMEALLNRLSDGGKAVRSARDGRTYPRRWSESDDVSQATERDATSTPDTRPTKEPVND